MQSGKDVATDAAQRSCLLSSFLPGSYLEREKGDPGVHFSLLMNIFKKMLKH